MNNVPATDNTIPFTQKEPDPVLKPVNPLSRFGVSLIPFTPVSFDDPLSWVRLGIYGTIAISCFKPCRPVSYIAMGAGAIAISTSMAGGYWNKQNGNN